MDRFKLNRELFDQIVQEIRNDKRPFGSCSATLEDAIDDEDQLGVGNGFDPDNLDGESDYLDALMADMRDLGVLVMPEGSETFSYIGSTLDSDGYRQITVGGVVKGLVLAGFPEKGWHLTDGESHGVAGVWAAVEAAVAEANTILAAFDAAVKAAA